MKNKDAIIGYIAEQIEEITLGEKPASGISGDQRIIDDIGLDSLDYATVLLACESWLAIKVREENVDWRAIDTVEKLAVFLEQQQSS